MKSITTHGPERGASPLYLSRRSRSCVAQRGSGPSAREENCTECRGLKPPAAAATGTTRPGDSHSAGSSSADGWEEEERRGGKEKKTWREGGVKEGREGVEKGNVRGGEVGGHNGVGKEERDAM